MVDTCLVRYVDDQRTQVRWLLSQMQKNPQLPVVDYRCYFSAAVRAIHLALTGYFAELTQRRYSPELWPLLVACGGSFIAMQKIAQCQEYLISTWLLLETDSRSFFQSLLATLNTQINPQQGQYKSSLMSDTSLSEVSAKAVIVSSAGASPLTLSQLEDAWADIEAVISRERAQALEC